MTLPSSLVGEAYHAACLAELAALKPGNVSRYGPGHGMSVEDFETSAAVSATVISRPDLSVGAMILEAVRRTKEAVGCNTNLGILLLAAPLALAAQHGSGGDLRLRLGIILARLNVEDAKHTFAAIRLAEPGGLGESRRHDVRAPARVNLRDAMAEARDRDRIAAAYVDNFSEVFECGVPWLRLSQARWGSEAWAATRAYLSFLSTAPDSHVQRKFGPAVAEETQRRAQRQLTRLMASQPASVVTATLKQFDAELKAEGINPGTAADLTVATLFAARLQDGLDSGSGSPSPLRIL